MSSNRNRGWPAGRRTHNRAQSFIHRAVSLSMAVVLPLASTLVLGVRVAVAQSGTCTGPNCSQVPADLLNFPGLNAFEQGALGKLWPSFGKMDQGQVFDALTKASIDQGKAQLLSDEVMRLKGQNQCQGANCKNSQCQGSSCGQRRTADGYDPSTGRDKNGAGSMGGGSGGGAGGGGAGGMLAGLMGKMGQLLPLLLMMMLMMPKKSPSPAPDPNTLPGVPTLVPTLTPTAIATPLPTATATPRASGTPGASLSGF